MIEILEIAVLVLVGMGGTAVVLTREPSHQVVVISAYGLMMTVMFVVFQAPDVGLSQLVIGAVGLPLMVLLAMASLKRYEGKGKKGDEAS